MSKQKKGEALKFDSGKPQLSLNPAEGLVLMARALQYGAGKYARGNFRKGMKHTRLLDACLRHLAAYCDGEDNDPESGVSHIGHALANLAMLSFNLKHFPENDDR